MERGEAFNTNKQTNEHEKKTDQTAKEEGTATLEHTSRPASWLEATQRRVNACLFQKSHVDCSGGAGELSNCFQGKLVVVVEGG